MKSQTSVSTHRSYNVKHTYQAVSVPGSFMSHDWTELTQTIQTVIMPFIARLRWLIARALGCPPFRADGGGNRRTLKVSKTFRKT